MADGLVAWIDSRGGVSGDMLLGACLDAGAPISVVIDALHAVGLGDQVSVTADDVRRGEFRATHALVETQPSSRPRRLGEIIDLIEAAALSTTVTAQAIAVFQLLADAESRVHGIAAHLVHFHEVGALDSLTDIVGTLVALEHLGVRRVVGGPISLGGGSVQTQHGLLRVPGPAVLELLRSSGAAARGGPVDIELATPTGVALLVTLAERFGAMPAMDITTVGIGAGSADPEGHANVCRLVIGEPLGDAAAAEAPVTVLAPMTVLETNVDDLDPRLWPGTIQALLDAGAADAWLTPILMKKGRPAHTLHVLAPAERIDSLTDLVFQSTTSIGLRTYQVDRTVLARDIVTVHVDAQPIRVKRAWHQGRVVNAEPEFDDIVLAAAALGLTPREVLRRAQVSAHPLL